MGKFVKIKVKVRLSAITNAYMRSWSKHSISTFERKWKSQPFLDGSLATINQVYGWISLNDISTSFMV